MRLKCEKCGWVGSYVEAKSALKLIQSGAPCPSCGGNLVAHYDSDGEERRFEDLFMKTPEVEKVEAPVEPSQRLGKPKPRKDEGFTLPASEGETDKVPAVKGIPDSMNSLPQRRREDLGGEAPNLLRKGATASDVIFQADLSLDAIAKLMDSIKGLAVLNQVLSERLKAVEPLMLRLDKLERRADRLEDAHETFLETATAVELHGERKAVACAHQGDDLCRWWTWDEKPEVGLRAAQDNDGKWLIQPNPPFCAACPAFQEKPSTRGLATMINKGRSEHAPETKPRVDDSTQQVAGKL